MKLPILQAIGLPENATFDSAHDPIRVKCQNLENYIIKGNHSTNLFNDMGYLNEFLCSHLLPQWGIKTPEIAIVNVSQDLLKDLPSKYRSRFYENWCFGSKEIKPMEDFLPTLFNLKKGRFINQFNSPSDFIKIGLFDLWILNLDRNPNHSNLIMDVKTKREIYAIDHYYAFNKGSEYNSLNNKLCLTPSQSILSAPLVKKIAKEQGSIDSYKKYIDHSISKCRHDIYAEIDRIESYINFKIPLKEKLVEFLFDNSRNKNIFTNFLEIIV